APQALNSRSPRLPIEPALARGLGWPRCPAQDGRLRGRADHLDQPRARILTVLVLAAVTECRDHDHALTGEPPAGDAVEPRAHVMRQRRRVAGVEAKLNGARDLVHVLPARARGADEAFLDLAFVEPDAIGDANHERSLRVP